MILALGCFALLSVPARAQDFEPDDALELSSLSPDDFTLEPVVDRAPASERRKIKADPFQSAATSDAMRPRLLSDLWQNDEDVQISFNDLEARWKRAAVKLPNRMIAFDGGTVSFPKVEETELKATAQVTVVDSEGDSEIHVRAVSLKELAGKKPAELRVKSATCVKLLKYEEGIESAEGLKCLQAIIGASL